VGSAIYGSETNFVGILLAYYNMTTMIGQGLRPGDGLLNLWVLKFCLYLVTSHTRILIVIVKREARGMFKKHLTPFLSILPSLVLSSFAFAIAIFFSLLLVARICFALPAFPGAEGFGANSVGGRGGSSPPYSFTVYQVTNLNDSGPGSFRAACEASGPRFVVFRTAGWVDLESPINITNPYITIAGQTAPGIFGLRVKPTSSICSSLVDIQTHDVIIRYITVRPGVGACTSSSLDAIGGAKKNSADVYNWILDHISAGWAIDQISGSWYRNHNVTWQWNFFSEGLDCSTHGEKQCHSCGPLIGSDCIGERSPTCTGKGAYDISYHHNLHAHNAERNPLFKISGFGEIINNVSYNSSGDRSVMVHVRGECTEQRLNIVKNYTKKGPDSKTPYTVEGWYYTPACILPDCVMIGVYVEGNIDGKRTSDSDPQVNSVSPDANGFPLGAGGLRNYMSETRYPGPTVAATETDATQAYIDVLAYAGNCRGLNADGSWTVRRDAVDKRVLYEIQNGTGKIIDAPWSNSCVGLCRGAGYYLTSTDYTNAGVTDSLDSYGYPILSAGTPYTDIDHDGMPDEWEVAMGLSPNIASDARLDTDGDGYTNLEEYLNGTHPRHAGDPFDNGFPAPPNRLRVEEVKEK
jgi:hypothetical protein